MNMAGNEKTGEVPELVINGGAAVKVMILTTAAHHGAPVAGVLFYGGSGTRLRFPGRHRAAIAVVCRRDRSFKMNSRKWPAINGVPVKVRPTGSGSGELRYWSRCPTS